jgi:Asp/Glu/hydantoin racemase
MKIMFLSHLPRKDGDESSHARVEALLRSYASPGTQVDLLAPDDFPGGYVSKVLSDRKVLNGLHHATEVNSLVRKTLWAAENGYDAVIQSDGFDPGVEESRLAVRIPVIGVMRTTLHVAATLGSRIGITVPLDSHIYETRKLLTTYGFTSSVTDVRSLEVYGPDLPDRQEELRTKAIAVMKALVSETGAEVIIPFGGALIPYVVPVTDLVAEVNVPIMNTKAIVIRFAETCVDLGLVHSRIAYPMTELHSSDFDRYYNS